MKMYVLFAALVVLPVGCSTGVLGALSGPSSGGSEAATNGDGQQSSSASSSSTCCVNGSFYSCPGAVEAAQCVGEPFDLMSCIDGCSFDSGCEDQCIADHGPDPSSCQRDTSGDASCTN
jgi:hypothetical protein